MSDVNQPANRSAGKGCDPFAAYGAKAVSTAPDKLLGPVKLRADARLRYAEMVAELAALESSAELEAWLGDNRKAVAQFAAELQFLWLGDGDFRGLEKEIEWARARFDDGLDFPRWEVGQLHASAPLA